MAGAPAMHADWEVLGYGRAPANLQDVLKASAVVGLAEMSAKCVRSNTVLEGEIAAMKQLEQERLSEIAELQKTVIAQSAQIQQTFELEDMIRMMKQAERQQFARIAELQHEASVHAGQADRLQEITATGTDHDGEPEAKPSSACRAEDDQPLSAAALRSPDLGELEGEPAHCVGSLQRASIELDSQELGCAVRAEYSAAPASHAGEQERVSGELRSVERDLRSQVANLQQALANSISKVSELEETMAANLKRSSQLEAVVDAMQKTEQDYELRVAHLHDKLCYSEGSGAASRKRATEVEEQLACLSALLAERDAEIAQLRQAGDGCEPQGNCISSLSSVSARIDELSKKLELQGLVNSAGEREAVATRRQPAGEQRPACLSPSAPRQPAASNRSPQLDSRQVCKTLLQAAAFSPRTSIRINHGGAQSPLTHAGSGCANTPHFPQRRSWKSPLPRGAFGGSPQVLAVGGGGAHSPPAAEGARPADGDAAAAARCASPVVPVRMPDAAHARCASPIQQLQSRNGPQMCCASPVRMPQSLFGSQSISLFGGRGPDAGGASPLRPPFRS